MEKPKTIQELFNLAVQIQEERNEAYRRRGGFPIVMGPGTYRLLDQAIKEYYGKKR